MICRYPLFLLTIACSLAVAQPPESAEESEPSSPAEGQNGAAAAPQSGQAGVVTLSTTVTGNQEQPKVLYIVPWQSAQDERILNEPLNSQTNRVFSHVERSEHLRELEFISEFGGNIGE